MNLGIGFYGTGYPNAPSSRVLTGASRTRRKTRTTRPYFAAQQIELFESLGVDLTKDTYVKYNDIVAKLINDPQKRFTQHWDDEAKVPWLSVQSADGQALFALSYEDPRSVVIKADYIKSKGLGGAMFWEYGADDQNQLAKQLVPSHWGSNADLRGVSASTIGYDNPIPLRRLRRSFSFATKGMGIMAYIPKNYARLEVGYREKALKLFPWVCGRCSREFVYSNLRELTVHHIDHDHSNNPEDGSNWEMLCLYCHDHEHSKYTEADLYGSTVVAGEDAQKSVGEAKYNPFADLKAMMNKK